MPTPEVNGSKNYQIGRLEKFDRTYQVLIKKHYRKNAKARSEFEQLVDNYIKELESNPCGEGVSDAEKFPADTAEPEFDLRKKRWRRLPGLQGAARFGRLIFIVYHPRKIVYLVWIYTHAEFPEPQPRPPDKELKKEIDFVKQNVLEDVEEKAELEEIEVDPNQSS